MVSRIAIILGLVCGSLWGQSGTASTSVYLVAFTNVTAPTITSSFSNIGQTSHFVSLTFSNAPAKTCAVATNLIQAGLEYSFDQTNWILFGTPNRATVLQLANPGGSTITFYGSGAFPYIRFNLSVFDTVNCIASAYYTGASNTTSFASGTVGTGTIVTTSMGSDNFPASASNSTPITVLGVTTGGLAAPLLGCNDVVITPTTVAAGTFHLLTPIVGRKYFVCGITATAIGVATIQLVQGAGGTCTSSAAVSPQFNLIAGVPLNIGGNFGVLYSIIAAQDVCIVTTGANVGFQAKWTAL